MKIGSLCTGYGGLDEAVVNVTGGHVSWVADTSVGACKVFAHRFHGKPNLGDISLVKWEMAEKVDFLTAGFPCQPISVAGRKKGVDDDRWLWPFVADAIRGLRPELVFLENVSAILVRGFPEVLGSLAEIGYDCRWTCVPAYMVGAPHTRERWFAVAYPTGQGPQGPYRRFMESSGTDGCSAANSGSSGLGKLTGGASEEETWQDTGHVPGDHRGARAAGDRGEAAANPDEQGLEGDTRQERSGGVAATGHADSGWGLYETAIRRWESCLGRHAPVPLIPSRKIQRLNPVFVEWMMGLSEGWVTDVPDLTYKEKLMLLGNGVVPQQAEYAFRLLLDT